MLWCNMAVLSFDRALNALKQYRGGPASDLIDVLFFYAEPRAFNETSKFFCYRISYQANGRGSTDLFRGVLCSLRAPAPSQASTCTEAATGFSLPW